MIQTLAATEEPASSAEALSAAVQRGLHHASHLLPDQAPINVFVHHNTLHAFQHLHFHEAVLRARDVYGAEPYLSEEKYRSHLAKGRITEADLMRALRDQRSEDKVVFGEVLSEQQILLTMLRFPIRAETAAALDWLRKERGVTRSLRRDIGAAERKRFMSGTRQWLASLLEGEDYEAALQLGRAVTGRVSDGDVEGDLLRVFGLPLECRRLRPALSKQAEELAASALWHACRSQTRAYRAEPPGACAPRMRLHRDLLLAALGEDVYDRVNPVLIRVSSAYLDEGLASWSMPGRQSGFYAAVRRLWADGSALPLRWQEEARRDFREQLWHNMSAMQAVVESLDELGVDATQAETYVQKLLLTLPGWAGLVSRLERHPDDRPHGSPKASLLDFLAVRLTYECAALRDLARGTGRTLRALWHAQKSRAPSAAAEDGDGAYRLFQLMQLSGIPVPAVRKLSEQDALGMLALMDRFDEAARRRVFQEAFELHHRVQILDAIATYRADWALRRPPPGRPSTQFICCFDDREEAFRRHLEEIEPSCQTFGAPGFFGAAMRFRALDEAREVPLAPAVIKPVHRVEETAHAAHVERSAVRQRRRRIWGQVLEQTYRGSRSLWRGAVLNLAFGIFALGPLLLRVTSPWVAGRLRRWAGSALLPQPKTELTVQGSRKPNSALGFTSEECVARAATLLENIGLTHNFARLVILLGHGATTLNNPHKSAYDCGACGGRQGGPNARVFARMANAPEVRAGLAQRGIHIPMDTIFIGGQHDTCSEQIVLFDLDQVDASHREDLSGALTSINEARARTAHERCRRLLSAPRHTTPQQALAHVEGRSEHLAEPRPEFGHATNAVAIIGRRALTRGLFLDRRAFVLSYDPTLDADGNILERVLGPATAVGAGINLEYYFSHVDNERYGAGSKLPHNVAGLLGVMTGHASDLRTGLPRQMIEIHEAVRLLVLVEASPQRLLDIANRQPDVADFIVNRWVQLVSVDPASGAMQVFTDRGFEPYTPQPVALPEAATSRDFYHGHSDFLPPARILGASARM